MFTIAALATHSSRAVEVVDEGVEEAARGRCVLSHPVGDVHHGAHALGHALERDRLASQPLEVVLHVRTVDRPAGLEGAGEQEGRETPHDFERFYQRRPYGRVATRFEERFPFRLTAEPSSDARLGVNVVAYTGHAGFDGRMGRRRRCF